MPSLNRIQIIGHAGREPELKSFPNGNMATFSLATSEYGGKDKPPVTEWHNIKCFNKQADFCAGSIKKGALVYVEGKIRTESWGENELKKTRTYIYAELVLALDKRDQIGSSPQAGNDGVPF